MTIYKGKIKLTPLYFAQHTPRKNPIWHIYKGNLSTGFVGRESWNPQVKVQPSKAKVGTTIFDLLTLQISKKPENNTVQELGLISLHLNKIGTSTNFRKQNNTTNTHPVKDKIIQNLLTKHKRVFEGTGKLQNRQVELIVDRSVKPVVQRQRRIPFHLRAKVDGELNCLEAEDIIEKIPDTDETSWISPVVIVPKKEDKIRLCVDMRAAN